MKIAICIAGMSRNYDKCYQSMLDYFTIDGIEFDFFIHTWTNVGYKRHCPDKGVEYNHHKDSLKEDLINIYKPKKITVEDQFECKEIKQSLKTIKNLSSFYPHVKIPKRCKIDLDNYDETSDTFSALTFLGFQFGHFCSIEKASKLRREYEQENNFRYDLVFRFRSDFLIPPKNDEQRKRTYDGFKQMCEERGNTKCGGDSIWTHWISICGQNSGPHVADHVFGGGSAAFDIFNDLLQHATRRMIRHSQGDLNHWCTTGEGVIGDLIMEKGVYARAHGPLMEIGHEIYRDYHREAEDQSIHNIKRLRMEREHKPRRLREDSASWNH